MPQVMAERTVRLDAATAFELSQTTGGFRLKWDPFIHSQHFEGGATQAAKGVRTRTRTRMGLLMVSEYVSYVPGRNVGMKMVSGPWFFHRFGAGWRFPGTTAAPAWSGSTPFPAGRDGCGGWPTLSANGSWGGKSSGAFQRLPRPAGTRP